MRLYLYCIPQYSLDGRAHQVHFQKNLHDAELKPGCVQPVFLPNSQYQISSSVQSQSIPFLMHQPEHSIPESYRPKLSNASSMYNLNITEKLFGILAGNVVLFSFFFFLRYRIHPGLRREFTVSSVVFCGKRGESWVVFGFSWGLRRWLFLMGAGGRERKVFVWVFEGRRR